MKSLFFTTIALLFISLAPRQAQAQPVDITSCGYVINTDGYYYVPSSLSCNSTTVPVIEITGLNGGGSVTINCLYNSLTNTASTGSSPFFGPPIVYVHDNPGGDTVATKYCDYEAPNSPAYPFTTGEFLVTAKGTQMSTTYDTFGNVYYSVDCSGGGITSTLENSILNASWISISGCPVYVENNTFQSYAAHFETQVLEITNSNNAVVSGNTISGNGYIDSPISFANSDLTGTTVLTGDQASGNTISNTFDVGVEFFGAFTHATVSHNSCSACGQGITGGYYYTSQDNLSVYDNTLTIPSGSNQPLIVFSLSPSVSLPSPFWTDNTFYNNTASGAGTVSDSAFGYVTSGTSPWTSANWYGNVMQDNNLGTIAYFGYASIFDAGGNTCSTVIPAYTITCH